MQLSSRQRGVSLIEVLVAVLIFSIGLIGLAGMLVMATRSNQAAYLRTQVTFLAHNMAARMTANPIAVWNGDYNSTGYPTSTTQSCATGCTPAQLATYDQQMWSSQLKTFLPNPSATIACSNGGLAYNPVDTGRVDMRPSFGGTCKMTITWSERGVGGNAKVGNETNGNLDSNDQTFAWEFQP